MAKEGAKIAFWVIFGVVVVGGVALLAHKIFGKPPVDPAAALDQAQQDATADPTPENVQRVADVKQATTVPVDSFPLKNGSHGTYVQGFQKWLISNNSSALPKYGADGIWGSETQAEAVKQGVTVPVTQVWYDGNITNAPITASGGLVGGKAYDTYDTYDSFAGKRMKEKRFDNETALSSFCAC